MSESKARKCVLGLFAKWPSRGHVKTRLAQDTSPEWAAKVADAFLRDSLSRCAELPYVRYLAFAPPDAEPSFAELTQDRYTHVPQSEGDLGRRMSTFLEDRLAEGADAVVLLGTDSPTVPLAYIEQAFERLRKADVVLGPAVDGGYYLLGCTRRIPPIFDGVEWGSSSVLAQTCERLADGGWTLAVLPPWYDVDTPEEWAFLRDHVKAHRAAGEDFRIPWTEGLFER